MPLPRAVIRPYLAPVDDDDWRHAIPEETPPFFFHVEGDAGHGVDVVGRDEDGLFCIDDDEHDRSVWWVSDRDPRSPHRFVNTSVERFRDSLGIFYETWRSLRRGPDGQVGDRLVGLRRELAAIDPGVAVEPDDYWPVILAQMEERLLSNDP